MPTLTNMANAVKAAALDAGFELAGVASIGSCEELEHYHPEPEKPAQPAAPAPKLTPKLA